MSSTGRRRAAAATAALVALAGAASALAALVPRTGLWKGTTKGPDGVRENLTFQVRSQGGAETVFQFAAVSAGHCQHKATITFTPGVSATPVISGASFSAHDAPFPIRLYGATVIGSGTASVSGTFTSPTRAHGTYEAHWRFLSTSVAGGYRGYVCSTGSLTWSARG
jgi:hypothetical protein